MANKRKRTNKGPSSGDGRPQKRAKASNGKASAGLKPALDERPFSETPTPDERKKEAALYDLLGSEDPNERIDAAKCIIARLLGGDGVPESVLERHLEKRLFRGIASGRNAARVGFSLALAEILGQLFGEMALADTKYTGLTFRGLLGVLVDKTNPPPSAESQEGRDHLFGRLFGLEAFVNAKVLFGDSSRWGSVLDLILELAGRKVWIRSQCGWLIVQAVSQMNQEQAGETLNKIAAVELVRTAEGVAVWIAARDKFPDLAVKPWDDIFSGKHLTQLSGILREQVEDGPKDGRGGAPKQPNWTAQLHFVWHVLLSHVVSSMGDDLERFEKFWHTVIDDGFYSRSSSDGQKFRGFVIFQTALQAFSAKGTLPDFLFSHKLMSCLMNQAAKEDRYLHRAATKVLKAIEGLVASEPDLVLPFIKGLLGEHGDYMFDRRTRTKTIDKILSHGKPELEKKVVKQLRKGATVKLKDEQATTGRVRTYTDYLARLLTSMSIDKHLATTAIGELCQLAYSAPPGFPEGAVTEQTRSAARNRLEAAFAKLITRMEDFNALSKAVLAIDSKSMRLDKEIRKHLEASLKRIKSLAAAKDDTVSLALSLLYSVAVLLLYNQDPDALNILSDLDEYSSQIEKHQGASGGSEFLVEILLSLVVRPSSLMRQVSQKVFEVFSEHISEESLKLLTDPLSQEENAKGQKELFNTDDDEMDIQEDEAEEQSDSDGEDDHDDVDIEVGSDVQFVTLNGAGGGEEEEEDDDDDDDDDDVDDEEKEEETKANGDSTNQFEDPEALERDLAAILGTHRLDKDAEADSSDSSDSNMSDSEMLALDKHIAATFSKTQTNKNSKKDKKDARETVVNFKNRILDLLDIYLKKEAANPLAVNTLVPLLQLIRTTSTKPLANRAGELLQAYFKALRKARQNKELADDVDVEAMTAVLGGIHDEASRDLSHAFAKAASSASLTVASVLFEADKESIEHVAALYASTQTAWVLGKIKVQPSFFTEWVNWCQSHASNAKT